MSTNILGISCFFHDAAACLIRDGKIIAAAQEERFTRIKHDPRFPTYALNYCLEEGRIEENQIDTIVFYEKPLLALDRIAQTLLGGPANRAQQKFDELAPSWAEIKLHPDKLIAQNLKNFSGNIIYAEHHLSHAASAFFPSPYDQAAILTLDGVGEWATATIGHGSGHQIAIEKEMRFPHSLGLLYSAFTYFTGFRVNSGEYKLMGLAPYGQPKYSDLIKDQVIVIHPDGSIRLNLDYFDFELGDRMTSTKMDDLFKRPARQPEAPITQNDMDIAASIQEVTEEIILLMARQAREQTGLPNLCLAGGVALNCVANGKIHREGIFDSIWIQPASGDAGCALGAALAAWHVYENQPRLQSGQSDQMQGALLGPEFSDDEIRDFLELYDFPYQTLPEDKRAETIASIIAEGNIVGHFQGRMEFGPRALGNRSILGDPRHQDTQSRMNLKIKFRESFRPFAPIVLREKAAEWFELDCESPYMLMVAPVHQNKRLPFQDPGGEDLLVRLKQSRSEIPAVTHIDCSARIQTIDTERHPTIHKILSAFEQQTGVPVLVNTSFNVRGEPIVCTPQDAYRCMMRTHIDCIVMGNTLVWRKQQPNWEETESWQHEFVLD